MTRTVPFACLVVLALLKILSAIRLTIPFAMLGSAVPGTTENRSISSSKHGQGGRRSEISTSPPSPIDDELNVYIKDYRVKNPSQILLERNLYKRGGLRLNLTMGCTQSQPYGAGNALARIFATRLLALATNSTFSFRCNDLPSNMSKEALCSNLTDGNPCLLTQFETDTSIPESRDVLLPHTLPDCDASLLLRVCEGRFPHMLPYCLGNYSQSIIQDIRTVAKRAATTHGLQRDDVVIHFRCGDVLGAGGSSLLFSGDNGREAYGLIPHGYYVDRIASIGATMGNISIVTQPFDGRHTRLGESKFATDCKVIIEDLKLYLKEEFPAANVHIRNNPEEGETSYTSFMRLVLARKASFCGPSSFCTTAVLSTLAERGYIFAKEPWPRFAIKIYDHLEFVKGGPIIRPKGIPLKDLLGKLRDMKFGEKV